MLCDRSLEVIKPLLLTCLVSVSLIECVSLESQVVGSGPLESLPL